MGDKRVYGNVVQLRAVQTTDFMTATVFEFSFAFLQRVSSRIVNEVQGVTRVGYDSKCRS
jgi:GMP synthase (glutamine-hydrolysing)